MSRRLSNAKGSTIDRLNQLEDALRTTIDKADAFFKNTDTKIIMQGKKNGEQDEEIGAIHTRLAFLQNDWLDVRAYLARGLFYRLFHRLPLPKLEGVKPSANP